MTHITRIRLDKFRNFLDVELFPHKNLNVIYGDNGAGKSSVLEAIHVLGFGRSFRTSKPDSFINYDATSSSAHCQFSKDNESMSLGFTRSRSSGFEFSVNAERTKKKADIARLLPVQIFTPQSSDLILGPPIGRRRYIDWLLFHVEQRFQLQNSQFQACLNHRNALLKQKGLNSKASFKEQDVWRNQLAVLGESITNSREAHILRLNAEISTLYEQFCPELNIVLRYNKGWDKESSLLEAIENKTDKDLLRGITSCGPHKADIQFLVNGKNAAEFLSRGQLRLLVSILLLGEVVLLKQITGKQSLFLIDDISAELDEENRQKFISTVLQQNTQVFVTAIERRQMSFIHNYKQKKVFHVEQNHVIEE